MENSLDLHLLLCFLMEARLIKKANNIIKFQSPTRVTSEQADCNTSQAGQRGSETVMSQQVSEQNLSEWWRETLE